VVRSGFSSPRKQLHNSLAHGLAVKPVEAKLLLKRADIDTARRAETLSLEEWARLYEVLAVAKKVGMQC
jgi:16S rRNA (adenine1518-N6/adenine1519-N6)-dimethyltransferase